MQGAAPRRQGPQVSRGHSPRRQARTLMGAQKGEGQRQRPARRLGPTEEQAGLEALPGGRTAAGSEGKRPGRGRPSFGQGLGRRKVSSCRHPPEGRRGGESQSWETLGVAGAGPSCLAREAQLGAAAGGTFGSGEALGSLGLQTPPAQRFAESPTVSLWRGGSGVPRKGDTSKGQAGGGGHTRVFHTSQL